MSSSPLFPNAGGGARGAFAHQRSRLARRNGASGGRGLCRSPVSRRRFLQVAGATAAGGAMLAGGLGMPRLARADLAGDTPNPIPGGFVFGGTLFHLFTPGAFGDPPDAEPSSIFDFEGELGYAIVDGTGTGFDPELGELDLAFEIDLRFMKGTYVGIDGITRDGTFACI